MDNITLASPYWLLSLLIIPFIAWLRGRRSVIAIAMPFAGAWQRSTFASNSKFITVPLYLGLILLVLSLARPQLVETERQSKSKGYDIMLAIDLSSSMLAEDYKDDYSYINRLQAVKPILNKFIKEREQDRVGLIAFSGRAYTVAPLTFDHEWLSRQTDRLEIGLIEDGTAIGDAIAVAVSRLQEGNKERAGEREGAFTVLLTDGDNTAGVMEPLVAAQLAKDEGIRVFTIAAGREGYVRYPVIDRNGNKVGYDRQRSQIDTQTLQQISKMTDGGFFRAQEKDTIEKAFETIDESNKVEFEVNQFSITTELFPYTANTAALLLILGALLGKRVKMEGLS